MLWLQWELVLTTLISEESLEANQEAAVKRATAALASKEAEITGSSCELWGAYVAPQIHNFLDIFCVAGESVDHKDILGFTFEDVEQRRDQ